MAFVVAALLMTLGAGAVIAVAQVCPRRARAPDARRYGAGSRRDRQQAGTMGDLRRARVDRLPRMSSSLSKGRGRSTDPRLPYGVSALLGLVAVVLYLRWSYRAVANTTLLRAPIEWTPRQAVAAYFIPIVSFFRPYQVMKALHAGSDPSALHDAPVFRYRPAPNYREAVREPLPPPRWNHPAPSPRGGASTTSRWVWGMVAKGFARPAAFGGALATDLAAAVLCALVIRSVDARQRERHRRLEASAA